jgi:hypothetical protein
VKRTISLEQAKAAKAKVSKLVGKHPDVNGIGVARIGRGFGVKVNLVNGTLAGRVPEEIDGVPVQVETVGPITARPVAPSNPAPD